MLFKDWTYDSYIESVKQLKDPYLRHDVDYDLDAAMVMAVKEKEANIHSTYFLLLTSPLYNLLERNLVPNYLIDLGHDVGLHFDTDLYLDISMQFDTLSKLCGRKVKVYSTHNPGIHGYSDWGYPTVDHIKPYVSDSCQAWRDDVWAMWESGDVPPGIHLNTHPINWDTENRNRDYVLTKAYDNKVYDLDAYFSECDRLWRKHPGVSQSNKRQGVK